MSGGSVKAKKNAKSAKDAKSAKESAARRGRASQDRSPLAILALLAVLFPLWGQLIALMTATVMASTANFMVGSGVGANWGVWLAGTTSPLAL